MESNYSQDGMSHSQIFATNVTSAPSEDYTTPIPSQEACCSANCSYNKMDDCESLLETFLRNHLMHINNYIVIRVALSWILFFISVTGNLIALWSVVASYRSSFNTRGLPNAQVMLLHMALADLAYTVFILPLDAVWNITGQWLAGGVMCKILMFVKHFAMYSSSGMITAMALERMTCILMQPTPSQQRKRLIILVASAWTFAFLNAIPALIIFGVIHVQPCNDRCNHNVTQCIDFVTFPQKQLREYYIYTMIISFFAPLLSIIICHSMIAVEITRMAVRDRALMGRRKSVTTHDINKARNKSLLMTVLITTSFLVCWAPYYVKGLYDWFEDAEETRRKNDGKMWMYLSMYLNPCLHPFIFAFFMKSVKAQFLKAWRAISCLESPKSAKNSSTRTVDVDKMVTTSFNGHTRQNTSLDQPPLSPTSEAKKSLISDPRKISFRDDVKE